MHTPTLAASAHRTASRSRLPRWLRGGTALCSLLLCSAAGATNPLEQLTQARLDQTVRFDAVLLEGDKTTTPMQLRAVSPWSHDAVVVVHGEAGTRELAPPPAHFYRGELEHEPGSRVMLRVDAAGAIKGLVFSGGGAWMLDAADAKDLDSLSAKALHLEDWHEKPTRFSCSALQPPVDQRAAATAAKHDIIPGGESTSTQLPQALRELLGPAAAKGGVTHMARVAVDTDHEYFQLFGNSNDAAQYMADLFAFISGIYEDEVQTALAISRLDLYDTPADPWTQIETDCALYEVGQLWNTQRTDVDRTITHFVSGKAMNGGIAWLGVLCSNPAGGASNIGNSCPGLASTGQYFGGYGVSGGLFGTFNPDSPGVVWDLVVIAHEIGHNFASPHTHCYGGIGGNANPVDECAAESGTGCFTGTPSLPGPLGQRSGTIMSYCHLLTGGLSNIESTFGAGHGFGTLPERVPSQMRQHVLDRAAGNAACLAPQSGLRLVAAPAQQSLCSTAAASASLNVSAEGFGSSATLPVTLGFPEALPAGFSLAGIAPNPILPGSSATLQLDVAAGTAAGNYTLSLQGSNSETTASVDFEVMVETAPTAAPQPTAPDDGAEQVATRPTFSWQAVAGAQGYRIEIADNPGFTDPVVATDISTTSFTPAQALQFGTQYHWRIASLGTCGSSSFAPARSFTVAAAVGQCPAGQSTQVLLQEDFEAGAPDWTQSPAIGDGGWGLTSARAASGSRSALSPGNNAISDRRLVSPPIQLPAGLGGLGLRFATFVDIEADPSICWDSARLEVSTDGGASFTGVPASAIQNRPYDAVVPGNYGNPLVGSLAWCGTRPSFETYAVDLSDWAGQTVRLGFRSTSDSSINREGWYIDDVAVLRCTAIDDSEIFENGFEQPPAG